MSQPRCMLPSGARILAAGLFLIGCPRLAAALDVPPLRGEQTPSFVADVAMSLDARGTPGIAVSVSVPFGELQWLRLGKGYGAGFEVTVVFGPKAGGRTYGDAWQRRIVLGSFDQTTSAGATVERRTFEIPPGRYELRVLVRDLQSEALSNASQSLEIPDYTNVPIGMADLELGVLLKDTSFEPVATRRFGLNSTQLAARAALFDRRPGGWPRGYRLRYRILDESGDELIQGVRTVTLKASPESVIVRPDSTALFVGNYTFEIELQEDRSRWRVDRTFEVEESGPPMGRDFSRMLEPLSYVADPGEIDRLSGVPAEEQAKAWEAFWRRRDPTPETARNEALIEFLRRVRYTEQHFHHFGPGWRSDMGRIYIKFGPPDQVETRPVTTQAPQLEIWYYNRPYRQFVFADREGFGRYVLVSPTGE